MNTSDTAKGMPMALEPDLPIEEWTDKQRLFVDKYFELGLNGTRAAIAAGYSRKNARQQASENLSKPYIRAEVDRRLGTVLMPQGEVLARLSEHGRGDMRDFIGKSAKALSNHPSGNLIKKFKRTVTTSTDKDGEKTTLDEKIELELYDAQAALVHIGRYYKLFIDRTDLTTNGEQLSSPVVFLPAVQDDDGE